MEYIIAKYGNESVLYKMSSSSSGLSLVELDNGVRGRVAGYFSQFSDGSLVIYRNVNGILFLIINGVEFRFSDVEISRKKLSTLRRSLSVSDGGNSFVFRYRIGMTMRELLFRAFFSDFGFDAENYDFGMFLGNIAEDKARQERVFRV